MYEQNLDIVRKRAVDKIFEIVAYDNDTTCHHDDFTFCPANFCKVVSLFNIYSLDLMERIRNYKPMTDEENPYYDFRKYWEHFVEYIIMEPNDFQVLV